MNCVDYWNEVLASDRQISGAHYPTITCELFMKWLAISEIPTVPMSSSLVKEWLDLTEQLEKELVITHGKENGEYQPMASHLDQVKLLARMMGL